MQVGEEEQPRHEQRPLEAHAQHDEAAQQHPDREPGQDQAPGERAAELAPRDHRPDDLERRDDEHQEEERVDEAEPQPAVPAHLVEAGAQLGQEARALAAPGRADAQRGEAGGAHDERAGVERHRTAGGDQAHKGTAERRAQAEREAARDAEQRVGLLQPIPRRDLRNERRRRRH